MHRSCICQVQGFKGSPFGSGCVYIHGVPVAMRAQKNGVLPILQCSKSASTGTHTHLASLPWICVRAQPHKWGPIRPSDRADQYLIWRSKGADGYAHHLSRGAGAPTSAT